MLAAILESAVGQTVTLDTYFTAGTYYVRFQAVAPSGVTVTNLVFDLDGTVVTDPIGPRTSDGESTGTTSSSTDTVTWSGPTN